MYPSPMLSCEAVLAGGGGGGRLGTHQARCCLLGAGCTLLAVGTLRESRCGVRTGAVTSYSAAISWRGQGGERVEAGWMQGVAAPHCLLCLGAGVRVTTCVPVTRLSTVSTFPGAVPGPSGPSGPEYVPGLSGPRAQLPAPSTAPPPAIPAHTLTPPVTTTLTLYSIVAK